MSSSLADAVRPFVDRGALSGAVLAAADRDHVLALEAVGAADLATGAPMRTDSLFWIASITKPMTATAFMMLVDEGKVSIDDPVTKYLPEFARMIVQPTPESEARPATGPILLRHLLSHTSGLPFGAPEEAPRRDTYSAAESIPFYAKLPLLTDPGAGYNYSNAGINTAARVMEIIAGESYESFLFRRLLEPLGMNDTFFIPPTARVADIAKTYAVKADKSGLEETPIDQLTYPLDAPTRQAMAAGGLFSNAADCLRYGQMMLRGGEYGGRRYLSEAAVQVMTSKQTGALEKEYGFCWDAVENGGHGGAYRTDLRVNARLNLVRVFLVQQRGDWAVDPALEVIPSFVRAAEALAGQ